MIVSSIFFFSSLFLSFLSTLHLYEIWKVNLRVHINWIFPLMLAVKIARDVSCVEGLSRGNSTFCSLPAEFKAAWHLPCSINKQVRLLCEHTSPFPSPYPPWTIITARRLCSVLLGKASSQSHLSLDLHLLWPFLGRWCLEGMIDKHV